MFRIGDRVTMFFNMKKKGTIINLQEIKNKTWLVGGAVSPSIFATVQFDDGNVTDCPTSDLMELSETN